MDSRKNKICKIFAIIMLNLYLRLATATNIDCHGKSFHCVNSTHFMICVDLGGGVSITVNDFVIQCPPTTVCGEDNHLECTYQMPTTTQTNIHLGDETNDFTTDTRIITTTLSDITNTISTIDKTSPKGLFNEYFNTIEVTTFAQDAQTYTTEVSGIPEILNNNNLLTNDDSNVLTATTALYSVENPPTKSPEMHSPNDQIISEQSFVATTVKDIERKTLFSDGPDLNVDSSSMKLMDALHDAPTETVAKNASTVIDREANAFKDVVDHFTQKNNRDIRTKSLSEIIASTETTLLTHYQKNHNSQNTSTRVENTTNQGDPKIHEADNIFTSVDLTQINDLMTKEENVTENSLFTSTDNYNFNSTRTESEIELTNEADLMGPKTQNIKLINTLSPFELNASEITVAYNFTNLPSTLEPTITTSGYVAEKVLISTESAISFNDNEKLMFPKRGTNPTSQSPILLEKQFSDNPESKSIINKINMTSLDNKLISEDSTIIQAVNELEKEIQNIKMETIFTSHLNGNTSSPDDDLLEGTSTIKKVHLTSTIDYRPTITGLNLPEQKIRNDKLKKSTSYEQHNPEVTVRGDISTTHANIPNLPVNTIVNSTNDVWTSLLTTFNSIEHVPEGNEAMETTTVYSNGILQKASQILTEESSSTVSPISFNYNASNTENITEMEMNTTSARDKYNYSSYEIMITKPQLNINDQRVEIMATETFYNTTEYNKILPQKINILQVTTNPYSNDISLSIENSVSKSELNLGEQQLGDNDTYMSTQHEQYKSEVSISENIPTTHPKTHDLSVYTESTLSTESYDFTTLLSTFEQATEIEQVTDRKEAIERTTVYHDTVPYTNLLANENEIEKSTQVALNLTQSEYHISDIKEMAKNESTPAPHYKNSTYKPGVLSIMHNILYDTKFEKTKPLNNLGVIKDSIYYAANAENVTEMEMNTTSVRDNHNSSYEIMITTPQSNIKSQRVDVKVTETSYNTTEYNKLLSQEVSISENILTTNQKTDDYSVNTESLLLNYDLITTSLLPTFEQATEIDQVTDRKKVIERTTIPYHNRVLYANLSENENATEKSPQVAHNSTQSEYRVSYIKKITKNETTPTRHYENSTYKPADQNIMQKILYDTQIENTKHLNNLGAIKNSNTENITEMNTTSARDNHNSSYEVMITTPQSNIKSQRVEVVFTETSHNTTEYNKLLSQEENILQMSENLCSNDTFLSIENSVSKSELYLEEQQIGDSNTYTSTQHEQYKSELSVSENISTTNPITYDFSVYTESTLSNYDFTTLLSTFKQATEIEQVTDRKKAIERTTIPYTIFLENENATERSLQVALNSTQSEYRISDIRKMVKNESTPARHYENSTYKPGVQNIIQKILYDTQIEKTKPLNNLGALKDSIVTTPGMYNVVSNIKVSESTTMKPELTPMAIFNSVSELAMIQNGQMKDIHPRSKSDLISSVAPLSQDGQNALISWRDVIYTSTENSMPKNNTVDLNRVTVDSAHGNLNFIEITANMTDNKNNSNIAFDTLQYKKHNEMVLFTDFDKFKRENKSSDTINEIYNADQITTGPQIDNNTHTTDVTIQNQEAFYDNIKPTSQDHNFQTTKKSLREGYNRIKTDILVTYDKVTSSTPKPLITTLVTGADEILSTHYQITTGVVTESYLAIANSKDMVINTTNKVFKSNFIHVQDNIAQVDVTQTKDAAQKLTDKLINNATEQYFITTTIRSNNETNTNIKDKNLFQRPYGHYFASNMSLPNLEKFKRNEEVDGPLETNLNLNELPPGIVENVDFAYIVTQKAKSVNVTDNFINGQSNVLSVNLPNQYYNNNSIQRNYTINDSEIVTSIPISDRDSDSSHTALYNRTINNGYLKNEELIATNEDRISNKRSMFVTTTIPIDETTFIIDKSYAVYKDRITTDKPPLNSQVFIDLPSSTTTSESRGIDVIGGFYEESNKANDTRKEHSSTVVAANSTGHSNLLKIPIQDLGSVTTVPYRPLVILKHIKQASLAPKLKQTKQEDDLHLNSTHGSNYKEAGVGQTKRVETSSITPRVALNVIKRISATRNLVKIKLLNNTNVGMKPNKRSTNATVFRCNYRSRGRFADTNNCRKYYICIGINKPILGECPKNTVFSEIKKQCTKNLSHCIRNNQFRCTQEGRFSDVLRTNIYYICVHYNNAYVRFQYQCQNGFHLNKTSVKCVKDIKYQSQSQITSLSADSLSNKGSDQSTVESQLKEKKQSKEDAKYICKKEGKFPDAEDCRRYYVCSKNSKSVFRRRTKKCDSDEVFHREKKKCVDIDSYECA